ncbi:hypothetical protein [Alkaliphilus peptidifermentans]|uniref:Uncharacterized protein n=1 Tax=Alkaliphilus peptidifermentans DSM 18978 TaxID=1120976 RepID=A0A1G5FL20_9FIRM|nr:hypothetical protein [Alkaliphilus peptidifermentans]SCY39903.1 hypothetical protein SAMN03080606_01454 [Alkaliphilus peptidifermentans DSM 18978]
MKNLKKFAGKYDFSLDKKQAWGHYRSYQFTIGHYEENRNIVTIYTGLTFENSDNKEKLDSILEAMLAAKEIQNYENDGGSLTITKSRTFGPISLAEIEKLMDHLVDEFNKIDAKPACFNCNNEGTKEFANYNNVAMTMCSTCYNTISNTINEVIVEQEYIDNNYGMGTLGAILGALLGSVVWIIIGLLGYIVAVAGLAIFAAATKGYMLFKGKINHTSLWIIGLVSFVALIIAQFITLDILVYKELISEGYDVSFLDTLKLTFELPFIDSEIAIAFIMDTIVGLVFAGLGAYGAFKKLIFEAKTPAGSLQWL